MPSIVWGRLLLPGDVPALLVTSVLFVSASCWTISEYEGGASAIKTPVSFGSPSLGTSCGIRTVCCGWIGVVAIVTVVTGNTVASIADWFLCRLTSSLYVLPPALVVAPR